VTSFANEKKSKIALEATSLEKFWTNVKTLDSVVFFHSISAGPICCTRSPSYFPLLEELERYTPSYLVYFTHLAKRTGVVIVMFI